MTSMKFVDWDHRPAVLVGDKAFAVLRPGAPWVSVDEWDVGQTGAELSEDAWRKFFRSFDPLDLSKIPEILGIPEPKQKPGYPSVGALVMARAQKRLAEDCDDADLALHAIKLERRALEAIMLHLSVLPEVET
jgi:hypothetical protein